MWTLRSGVFHTTANCRYNSRRTEAPTEGGSYQAGPGVQMALTADEVFAQWQPPITSPQGTEETYVVTTLVVTQEDGHTSWGQAEFYVDPASRVISGMQAVPCRWEGDFS